MVRRFLPYRFEVLAFAHLWVALPFQHFRVFQIAVERFGEGETESVDAGKDAALEEVVAQKGAAEMEEWGPRTDFASAEVEDFGAAGAEIATGFGKKVARRSVAVVEKVVFDTQGVVFWDT